MTTQMIIALGITIFMIILIMSDKLPFGSVPLLACLLLVIFGIADIKAAFAGFSNSTIVMLAEFMAIIAALQKTSFIAAFKPVSYTHLIVKTAVRLLGYDVGPCRAPFNQVPEEGIEALKKVLAENEAKGMH